MRSFRRTTLVAALVAACAACSGSVAHPAGDGGNPGDAGDGGNPDVGDGGPVSVVPIADGGSWAILFGGHFETSTNSDPPSDYYGDTWSWNGSSWTQLEGAGPGSRSLAAAAPFKGALLLYGGAGWSAIRGGPEKVAGPIRVRCGDLFVLYGGYDFTGSNRYDTWVFDGTAWAHFTSPHLNLEENDGGPQSSLGLAATSVNGTCHLIDAAGSMFTWSGSRWTTID